MDFFSKFKNLAAQSVATHNHFISTYCNFTDSMTPQAGIMPVIKKKFFRRLESAPNKHVFKSV